MLRNHECAAQECTRIFEFTARPINPPSKAPESGDIMPRFAVRSFWHRICFTNERSWAMVLQHVLHLSQEYWQ
jgi:hypothetical protein